MMQKAGRHVPNWVRDEGIKYDSENEDENADFEDETYFFVFRIGLTEDIWRIEL